MNAWQLLDLARTAPTKAVHRGLTPRPRTRTAARFGRQFRRRLRLAWVEWVNAVPHNIFGPPQKYDDPYRNVAASFPTCAAGPQPISTATASSSALLVILTNWRVEKWHSSRGSASNLNSDPRGVRDDQRAAQTLACFSLRSPPVSPPSPQEFHRQLLGRQILGLRLLVRAHLRQGWLNGRLYQVPRHSPPLSPGLVIVIRLPPRPGPRHF